MNERRDHFPSSTSRREFLLRSGGGIGGLALASLMAADESAVVAADSAALPASDPLAPRKPQTAPRAQRVIWLFMHGGPSHVDLFDPKPELVKYGGQPLPESF